MDTTDQTPFNDYTSRALMKLVECPVMLQYGFDDEFAPCYGTVYHKDGRFFFDDRMLKLTLSPNEIEAVSVLEHCITMKRTLTQEFTLRPPPLRWRSVKHDPPQGDDVVIVSLPSRVTHASAATVRSWVDSVSATALWLPWPLPALPPQEAAVTDAEAAYEEFEKTIRDNTGVEEIWHAAWAAARKPQPSK